MTHPIIKTDNYILITSDEEIKEDDYYICWDNCYDPARYSIYVKSAGENGENAKKIIAHLPLNNSPILEGVPLLPPLPNEDIDLASQEYPFLFIEGYKKAKEKYKFTEDDMRKAIDYCKHNRAFEYDFEKVMESISQPKLPVGFKCEIEVECTGNDNNGCFMDAPGHDCGCIKTKIINGVMQGEWIFE